MKKKIRQDKILEIINELEIETQEELVATLNSFDYNVTQATVSRDIKELDLIKVKGQNKKKKYAVKKTNQNVDNQNFNLIKNLITSVCVAQNIVVVKTYGGNGSTVGINIDKLSLSEIVGTVAGDDTVIVVTKDVFKAETVANKLLELKNND